ncbi:hypothetical protein M427DRAFT_41938 [Gonapodya prolifera JEL478]|uniref:Uncharacterized protein n=1 Tax=Gonapodya prolifera (strain JEL478) TaxID=1344416 RepID=A0A139AQQ3_GONPJ|nr:hypothetical protein M427DRAFT_41938 [Gonapodya prolifera JEL478]|eukprot:KXS19066.1 hypothetical protein M427DRAFT_41938 [Gonapodya prolifera JEL478]
MKKAFGKLFQSKPDNGVPLCGDNWVHEANSRPAMLNHQGGFPLLSPATPHIPQHQVLYQLPLLQNHTQHYANAQQLYMQQPVYQPLVIPVPGQQQPVTWQVKGEVCERMREWDDVEVAYVACVRPSAGVEKMRAQQVLLGVQAWKAAALAAGSGCGGGAGPPALGGGPLSASPPNCGGILKSPNSPAHGGINCNGISACQIKLHGIIAITNLSHSHSIHGTIAYMFLVGGAEESTLRDFLYQIVLGAELLIRMRKQDMLMSYAGVGCNGVALHEQGTGAGIEATHDNLVRGKPMSQYMANWMFGMVLPRKYYWHYIMTCLVLASPLIKSIGASGYFDQGLVVKDKSYWLQWTVVGRVLGVLWNHGLWVDQPHGSASVQDRRNAQRWTSQRRLQTGNPLVEFGFKGGLLDGNGSAAGPQSVLKKIMLEKLPLQLISLNSPIMSTAMEYRATLHFEILSHAVMYTLFNNAVFMTGSTCIGGNQHVVHQWQEGMYRECTFTVNQLKESTSRRGW